MDSFELPTDSYDPKGLRRRPARRTPLQPDDSDRIDLDDILDASRPADPDELPLDMPEEQPKQPVRRRRKPAAARQESPAAPETAMQHERRPEADRQQQPQQQQSTRMSAAEMASRTLRGSMVVPSVRNFFADGRLSIFVGVLLILCAAYMLVASISYIANAQADQSALINSSIDMMRSRSANIDNTTGWFGAMLSHFLVYRWLGIGSFVIIFYVGALGLTLVHLCHFKFWQLTFKSLVSAIALSLIIGLATHGAASPTFWGGEHGYYINSSLIDNASLWSAVAVSVAALTALILIFIKPLAFLFSNIGRALASIRDNMARRHDAAIEAAHRTEVRQQAERAAEAERIKQMRKVEAEQQQHEQALREQQQRRAADIEANLMTDDTVVATPSAAAVAAPTEPAPKPTPLDEIYTPLAATVDTESMFDPSANTVQRDTEEKKPESDRAVALELTPRDNDSTTAAATIELSDIPTAGADEPTRLDALATELEPVTADEIQEPNAKEPKEATPALESIESPVATVAKAPALPLMISLDSDVKQTDLSVPSAEDAAEALAPKAVAAEKVEETEPNLFDPRADLSHYRFPGIDLLRDIKNDEETVDEEEQEANKQRIINILRSYGVEISNIRSTIGPTITLYEIVPAPGVRISKIKRLGDDVALSLAAMGIRIIAPIPGKGTIGMEVPNKKPRVVSIRSILSSRPYLESKAQLPMALGTTIANEIYVADLAKMPHLLVAGATGMGKSVGLNTIIASLLYRKHPAELKFVLVDPKRVEFSLYKCIERHYLAKLPEEENAIIIDPDKVVNTLNSLCVEMENRYALLSEAGMRGIKEYNEKFIARQLNPEKGHRFLPYIVVVIDEFADLILTVGKEIETPISRIAAKARAVGIHIILATQRPSVNVITGVIKANFPGRMAFRVTQRNDSQTIIDRPGAEQLIGRGDMLISRDGIIERVQCAFIDTPEVEAICRHIASQQSYPQAYELPEMPTGGDASAASGLLGDRDPLFAEAGREVIGQGIGSTSSLQRKFNIGYPRAGKIMDQLEASGVVGPTQGGKPRAVLMDMYSFERLLES